MRLPGFFLTQATFLHRLASQYHIIPHDFFVLLPIPAGAIGTPNVISATSLGSLLIDLTFPALSSIYFAIIYFSMFTSAFGLQVVGKQYKNCKYEKVK